MVEWAVLESAICLGNTIRNTRIIVQKHAFFCAMFSQKFYSDVMAVVSM